ncbi:MAG: DNA-directed RNA polymerase subunit L [Candidatus Bathyarchaeota archaeon]|nr:DNA-directed RNA polymerase subunit L [Candidatus Bathyarchaeota archaeon]
MNIKVRKKTSEELEVEVEGEGHTFCNVLQRALLEDEAVEMAGYNIAHPLVANPVVYVRMKKKRKPKKKPEIALREATEKIRQQTEQFRKRLEEALKNWQQK